MLGNTVYNKTFFLSDSMREQLSSSYFAVRENLDTSLPFIQEMLTNHRKCPYWTLLHHFCPSITHVRKPHLKQTTIQGRKRRKLTLRELLNNEAQIHNVFLYVRKVFKIIVPQHVLGSRRNCNSFIKSIKTLLSLQLHSQLSLDNLVVNIRTKKIAWMKSLPTMERVSMLKQTIHFLVTQFVFPLVQSFFYVTESTWAKNKLFFYRKKTWHQLRQVASSRFINSCRLKKVAETWVMKKIHDEKCLGVSTVRFLVKSSSLRPITNLSFRDKKRVSVNTHLKTLLRVLTYEKQNNPEPFGATVMSVEDIHSQWAAFVNQSKSFGLKKLYFVKVDIENCYDSINPCLLFSVVSKLIRRTSYKIYKYRKSLTRNGTNSFAYIESCTPPACLCNETKRLEQIGNYTVSKEVLLKKLGAILFCNVLKIGPQHFVQTLGIPQGSILSSILCGAYYGYMEQTTMAGMKGKLDLLVRMVDDMLYVTPSKKNAHSFLRVMLEGIPEFNCRCNLSKCCTNFPYHHPVFGSVPWVPNNTPFKFCGLAFNTMSLNVLIDYSNFVNLKPNDIVYWDSSKHPGQYIRRKILSSVRPKCLSILFDQSFNSKDTINYNLMSIFAVCAVKFHCLVMHLPPNRRAVNNPSFFSQIILDLPQAFTRCCSQKLDKIQTGQELAQTGQESVKTGQESALPFSTHVVRRLCVQTFLYKLKKHHSTYVPVIERLQKMEGCHTTDSHVSNLLTQVFRNINI